MTSVENIIDLRSLQLTLWLLCICQTLIVVDDSREVMQRNCFVYYISENKTIFRLTIHNLSFYQNVLLWCLSTQRSHHLAFYSQILTVTLLSLFDTLSHISFISDRTRLILSEWKLSFFTSSISHNFTFFWIVCLHIFVIRLLSCSSPSNHLCLQLFPRYLWRLQWCICEYGVSTLQ